MTKQEREELIEKMARAAWESDGTTCDLLLETYLTEARAALAVAEPVIREQADIALREELAAVTERMSKLDFERTAAELERDALREENARLREALKPFADELKEQEVEVPHVTEDESLIHSYTLRLKNLRAAAAAIREGGTNG